MSTKTDNLLYFLVLSLPPALVTGPFLPDLFISICTRILLINLFIKKQINLFKNDFVKIFLIFYIYIVIRSLFTDEILFSLKNTFFYFRFLALALLIKYLIINKANFLKFFMISILLSLVIVSIDAIVEFSLDYHWLFDKSKYAEFSVSNRISGLFDEEYILGGFILSFFPITLILFKEFYKKKKKYFINFFLILSLISTVYYHQKYISKRDTLLLRNLDLNKSVNAVILSDKLKNLRWLTHHYPNNPEKEIENLLESIKIIEKDNRKKMIVTDYQFISVILSIKDNSAARIWWRHHLYPVPENKYYENWKSFLLNKIKKEKIEVIYTVHPLEGETDIFEGMINENCYSKKSVTKILTFQKLNECNELLSFKKL